MPLEIHMVHISEDDPKQYLVLATFMVLAAPPVRFA